MDDEDEWFFSSIKRYAKLQMFDFEKTVKGIDLSVENNLCIALEEDRNNKSEIIVCSLPTTLQLKSENSDLTFDRHISFNHGYYTDSPSVQIKCLPNKENIIISEKRYVRLYDISCKETDMIQKISEIPCTAITDAKVDVHPFKSEVALCGSYQEKLAVVNLDSMETIYTSSVSETDTEGEIIPLFCGTDVVAFGNTTTGSLALHDVRASKPVDSMVVPDIIETTKSPISRWIFNTTYGLTRDQSDQQALFHLFSTNGNFVIFDWRNLKEAVHYSKHPFDCDSKFGPKWNVKVGMCPTDVNKFSVCGFDENVYICELKENKLEVLFTHDGHPYSKDEFETNVTTSCSMWISFLSSNTLVSCASNTSLQCWQFLV